jgi:hypothetical protein
MIHWVTAMINRTSEAILSDDVVAILLFDFHMLMPTVADVVSDLWIPFFFFHINSRERGGQRVDC